MEDCFEGVICFETLNPPPLELDDCMDMPDGDAILAGDSLAVDAVGLSFSSKSRVLCKPSVEAIEAAIQIANVDPKKTVKISDKLSQLESFYLSKHCLE